MRKPIIAAALILSGGAYAETNPRTMREAIIYCEQNADAREVGDAEAHLSRVKDCARKIMKTVKEGPCAGAEGQCCPGYAEIKAAGMLGGPDSSHTEALEFVKKTARGQKLAERLYHACMHGRAE